ncbi:MAG: CRISPR-associated protein Cas4 [Actinomycetota bacterium]
MSSSQQDFDKLCPTGYALVLESVHNIPVDIGCVVYLRVKEERFTIVRDLFVINDDLRSWWIEERDKKMEIVEEEIDPGKATNCTEDCMYFPICKGT